MEVPTIIRTWIDTDGVTVYTVQYKDGSTCDMTVQQYDYLKASAQAVVDMDARQNAQENSSLDRLKQVFLVNLHKILPKVLTSATVISNRKKNYLLRGA